MNDTFWGLYEAQISALRSCTMPEEANMILLETAKFLVEHIDLSDETINQYDKLGIRKLFAAHNALGNAVTSFYDREREKLDPAARNGAIGQRMANLSEQIVSTSEALSRLCELEKELFAKEDELNTLETELESWRQKAIHLRETETHAAAEIQRFTELYAQLEATIAGHNDEIAFWEAHLGEDSRIVSTMKTSGIGSVVELLSGVEGLKESIRQNLLALDMIIKKVVVHEAQVREAVLKKQNKMV